MAAAPTVKQTLPQEPAPRPAPAPPLPQPRTHIYPPTGCVFGILSQSALLIAQLTLKLALLFRPTTAAHPLERRTTRSAAWGYLGKIRPFDHNADGTDISAAAQYRLPLSVYSVVLLACWGHDSDDFSL